MPTKNKPYKRGSVGDAEFRNAKSDRSSYVSHRWKKNHMGWMEEAEGGGGTHSELARQKRLGNSQTASGPKPRKPAGAKKAAAKPGIKITVKNRKTGKSVGSQNSSIRGEDGALWRNDYKKTAPTVKAEHAEGRRMGKQTGTALRKGAEAYVKRQRGKK